MIPHDFDEFSITLECGGVYDIKLRIGNHYLAKFNLTKEQMEQEIEKFRNRHQTNSKREDAESMDMEWL